MTSMKVLMRAKRDAHALDNSVRCERCGQCKHYAQLIYCEKGDHILCFAHGIYDGRKNRQRATFFFDPANRSLAVELRFGKCDDENCGIRKNDPGSDANIVATGCEHDKHPEQAFALPEGDLEPPIEAESVDGYSVPSIVNATPPELFGNGASQYWTIDEVVNALVVDPTPTTESFEMGASEFAQQSALLVACTDGGIRFYHEVAPSDQIGGPFRPDPAFTVYGTPTTDQEWYAPQGAPFVAYANPCETFEIADLPPPYETIFPTLGYASSVDLSVFDCLSESEDGLTPPEWVQEYDQDAPEFGLGFPKYDPDAPEWKPESEIEVEVEKIVCPSDERRVHFADPISV